MQLKHQFNSSKKSDKLFVLRYNDFDICASDGFKLNILN